jgi:hypothetical protein
MGRANSGQLMSEIYNSMFLLSLKFTTTPRGRVTWASQSIKNRWYALRISFKLAP